MLLPAFSNAICKLSTHDSCFLLLLLLLNIFLPPAWPLPVFWHANTCACQNAYICMAPCHELVVVSQIILIGVSGCAISISLCQIKLSIIYHNYFIYTIKDWYKYLHNFYIILVKYQQLYTALHFLVANVLNCNIIVNKFQFQLCYYIHFQTNTLGNDMNPLILSVMGYIVPLQ